MSAPQQITSFISEANAAGRYGYQNDPWDAASDSEGKTDHWLLSYIDILTLFLTLFVVLLVLQPKGESATDTQVVPAIQIPATDDTQPRIELYSDVTQPAPPLPSSVIGGESEPENNDPVTGENLIEQTITSPQLVQQASPDLPAVTATEAVDEVTAEAAPEPPATSPSEPDLASASPPATEAEPATDRRMDQLLEQLMSKQLSDRLQVSRIAEGVNLEVRDNILFAPGRAELKPAGVELLVELAEVLEQHAGIISVEGHTDDRPIANQRFPSNWELSSGRASVVARHLIGRGLIPAQLRAVGYADTRPLESNLSAEGRARNRRVTLILHFPPQPADPS